MPGSIEKKMPLDPLSAVFELGKVTIERIWPDPVQRAIELRKLEELKQKGSLAELEAYVRLLEGQLRVNAKEAEHKSVFVAGWRPFIGWVGGSALAYQFVLYPLLIWIWSIFQALGKIPADVEAPPVLEAGALLSIVTAMLGIGAQRSYDKAKGTDTGRVGK